MKDVRCSVVAPDRAAPGNVDAGRRFGTSGNVATDHTSKMTTKPGERKRRVDNLQFRHCAIS